MVPLRAYSPLMTTWRWAGVSSLRAIRYPRLIGPGGSSAWMTYPCGRSPASMCGRVIAIKYPSDEMLETLAMFSDVLPPTLTHCASGKVFISPNRLPLVVSLLLRLGRPGQRRRSGSRKQPRTVYVIHNAFDPLAYHVEPDG